MRILVENGCYHLRNMGDVAMLQVTVSRLSHLWPEARIEVLTNAPDLLAMYCPDAHPVAARGRRAWFADRTLFGVLYRLASSRVVHHLSRLERWIWYTYPSLAYRWVRLKARRRTKRNFQDLQTFLEAIFVADLVVVSGGGDLNDAFKPYAITLLHLLGTVIRRGIPTAMFGQGVGPIQNPELRDWAKAILPSVDLIAVRESRAGPALLSSLGVAPDRVVTTGDDAIELAYEARAEQLGAGIGVNLRVAEYSEVSSNAIELVRNALHKAAMKYHTPLIPLPISFHPRESDVKTIRHLLTGYDDHSDGGQSLNTPAKVIEEVKRCRVVVTGSYHPAVFALSQGIPVVGLAKSAYYTDKLLGLAEQFGTGCQVISLSDERLQEKLETAIDKAWESARRVRSPLLEAARAQIAQGYAAYQRVYEIVTAHCRKSFEGVR